VTQLRPQTATVTRDEIARTLDHAEKNPQVALLILATLVGQLLERCK